jgi:exopolysaccharide biosynthesis protein
MSTSSPDTTTPSSSLGTRQTRRAKKRKRGRIVRNLLIGFILCLVFLVAACYAVGFGTPWGNRMRLMLAETIISTRHVTLAHYITTNAEYNQLLKLLMDTPVVATGVPSNVHPSPPSSAQQNMIETTPVSGSGWTGYVTLVHDPKLVRLVPAVVHNGMGEYITDMATRTGAVGGTNASGFEDPKGGGWGGVPVGLVYVDGKVVQWPKGTANWTTVGFTNSGIMVMGQYTVAQLQNLGVRDAMQFHPELVVNGQPMITDGDGGWGAGPRTAIGQTKDGTVIFIVANGRFHGGAGLGATQRQVQDLMLQYGAVNACAMDGGSSSVLYGNGQILNSPSTIDPNGERHLPDAWLVFPTEKQASTHP